VAWAKARDNSRRKNIKTEKKAGCLALINFFVTSNSHGRRESA
jgi:hypothetical protein